MELQIRVSSYCFILQLLQTTEIHFFPNFRSSNLRKHQKWRMINHWIRFARTRKGKLNVDYFSCTDRLLFCRLEPLCDQINPIMKIDFEAFHGRVEQARFDCLY